MIRASEQVRGRHSYRTTTRDFMNKATVTELSPPSAQIQQPGQTGWYWVDSQPPSCDSSAGPAIAVLDADQNGLGGIRVRFQDPGFTARPQTGSGVGSVVVVVSGRNGGDLTIPHTVTAQERSQGYVELSEQDLWGYGGRWISAERSITVTATLTDRTDFLAAEVAQHTGSCSAQFAYPRVDLVAPTCVATPTAPPVVEVTAIHVLEPVNGRVGTVRVYVADPLDAGRPAPQAAGVASVSVQVNGGAAISQPYTGGGYVDIPGVDLLAGVPGGVPDGATWESFLSQARQTTITATVTDDTLLLAPEDAAQHTGGCSRTIQLRHDQEPPNCVNTPPGSDPFQAIHLIDEDEDAYVTVRVYVTDPGWDGVPPTGAGVGVVRISVNDQDWIEHAVTDAERAQGYVDFEHVDVFDGRDADDAGNPSVVIDGETFFTSATTTRITAQLDDRTLLFDPAELAAHQGDCDLTKIYDAPPPPPSVDAVRGADEIDGVWPQVDDARGYVWWCTRGSNPLAPLETVVPLSWFSSSDPDRVRMIGAGNFNGGVEIPAGTYVNSGPCPYQTDDILTDRQLWVHARTERFRILSATPATSRDWETVDRRPGASGEEAPESMPNGQTWTYVWWMSENGVTRDNGTRDNLAVLVRDPDGASDLVDGSDPDERILGESPTPPQQDPARVIVNVGDAVAAQDDMRVFVVMELPTLADPTIRYRMFEGESSVNHADVPIGVTGDLTDDTCEAGPNPDAANGDYNVIRTRYWVLRCDLLPASYTTEGGYLRFDLPLHPREYDEFPLLAGEQAPSMGAHNTDKPIPDRFAYDVNVKVADRRQAADNEYLTIFGNRPPDDPIVANVQDMQSGSVNHLVIDRVLPTIDTTLGQVAADDQTHMPVHIVLDDPKPHAGSDPTRLDASGLRDASIELLRIDMTDGSETQLSEQDFAYGFCSPAFPESIYVFGDRDGESECDPVLTPPTEIGDYIVRVHVRDVATNHAELDTPLVIPAAPTITAVRGAGGVAAWWPDVHGATAFEYTCTVNGVLDSTLHPASLDSSGYWRTDLCVAPAAALVTITVTPINEIGIRGPEDATAMEYVDRRPEIHLATSELPTRLDRTLNQWESSFNGRTFGDPNDIPDAIDEQTPDTIFDVTDLDQNLLTTIPPDEHLVDLAERPDCTPCANDIARAVVTFRPITEESGTPQDRPEAFHALVQLSTDPNLQLVRIWDGPRDGTAWDRTLDAADPDTCHPGEAGRIIHSQPSGMWTLDCSRITFAEITNGMRVRLPVSPRDLGEGASPRFPTPDKAYNFQGVVKDQRQAADHRFLTNAANSAPDDSPLAPEAQIGREAWLWVDRVLPRLDNAESEDAITTTGPNSNRYHHFLLHVIDPSGPETDPADEYASGVWSVHVTGGRVNPATDTVINTVIDDDATCQPGPTPTYQLQLTCQVDSQHLTQSGLYRYTVTLVDYVGNHREYELEEQFFAPPGQPLLGYEPAAYGSGIRWSGIADATSYLWECRHDNASGAVIASGTATAALPTGTWRTDVCHADPGSNVYTTVTAVGPGGMGIPSATTRRVDAPPSIATLDSPTRRIDSFNGQVYANTTTNHDIVIQATDSNLSINNSLDPSITWDGIPERPTPVPPATLPLPDRYARSIIAIEPPQGRPDTSAVFVITQYDTADPALRLVKIVDTTFIDDLANTPLVAGDELTDSATCLVGQGKVISAATWTINCSQFGYLPVDTSFTQTTIPIRPTSATPDQTYTVTGWVRESRQPVDHRYLSSDTTTTTPDQLFADAQRTSLGTLVVDRVLPVGDPVVPATTPGPVEVRVDAAHDVVPSSATTPTTFDATGLVRVTVAITEPGGSTLVAQTDMTCSPALPRVDDDTSDCSFTVTPTTAGTHTVTFTLYDDAGNHTEYVRTFDYATTPPPVAPTQFVGVKGARGAGAYWQPVANATSYTWSCFDVTANATVLTDQPAMPTAYPAWRTGLCPAAPGHVIRFSVTATGPGGTSPAGTYNAVVDSRPAIESGVDPDGSDVRYDTLNGAEYSNGTTNRDVYLHITDPDSEFEAGSTPSAAFDGLPERPATVPSNDFLARTVVALTPPPGRPTSDGARVVIQHHAAGSASSRLVKLVDADYAGDLATIPILSGQDLSDATVCRPGQAKVLTIASWTLDCSSISYVVASGGDLSVKLPLHPTATTPDQVYAVSGWVRDQRQALDYRYLSSDITSTYDQPFSLGATTPLGTIVVDRKVPTGTVQATTLVGNLVQVDVDAAHDVLPASFDATGLAAAYVTITDPSGTVIESDQPMSCTPALPLTADTATDCSFTSNLSTSGTHHVFVRLVDAAGNDATLETTFEHTYTPPPTMAPSVTLVRGAEGVVAKWSPVPDATSYVWTCENLTQSTPPQSDTVTYTSPSGLILHSDLCDGNASGSSAGNNIRVTVKAVNEGGEGPASTPASLAIDRRPTLSHSVPVSFNPDGNPAGGFIYFNRSGPVFANGTHNRDTYLHVNDADGDLVSLSTPDPDLVAIQQPGSAGDRARLIWYVPAPSDNSDPDAAVHVVLQLGPDDGQRLLRLVQWDQPLANLGTQPLNSADADTCAPGNSKVLEVAEWSLDCANFAIQPSGSTALDMRLPLHPRVGTDGTHLLPDRVYYPLAWLRDKQQPADNQSLLHSTGASTQYSDSSATRYSPLFYSVDRVNPIGTIDAEATGTSGNQRIQVTGSIIDVVPNATTNPTTALWGGIDTMLVTIDRIDNDVVVENVVTDAATTCNSTSPKSCTYTSGVLEPGMTYRISATSLDILGNRGVIEPSEVTIPQPPSGNPGYLDPAFGTSGITQTDIGASGADANDSTLLPNGNILSVGTQRAVSNGDTKLVLTSHTPSGALATGFGTGGVVTLVPPGMHHMEGFSVAIDSSNRILVGGISYNASYYSQLAVARLSANGTIDTSFGTSGYALLSQPSNGRTIPTAITQDQSGRIVVGGYEINSNTLAITRFLATGAPDTTFDTDGQAFFTTPGGYMEQVGGSLAIESTGKLLIGGNQVASGYRNVAIARVQTDGTLDTTYGSSGWYIGTPDGEHGSVRKLVVDDADRLLLALHCGGGCGLGIARLTADGVLDDTFGSSDDGATYTASVGAPDVPIVATARDIDMIQTADGKWVVAGQADQQANSGDEIAIGRFNADGTTDTSFGNGGYNITAVPDTVVKAVSVVQATTGDVVVTATSIPTTGNRRFLLAAYFT